MEICGMTACLLTALVLMPSLASSDGGCPSGDFLCDNGKCIPYRYVDDSDNDCGDWSDERYHSCSSGQFTCANRDCVNAAYVCDGDVDCVDGSDEALCGGGNRDGSTTYTPDFTTTDIPVSPPCDEFLCDNGNCVPHRYRDEGDNDCGDWSDEPNHSCSSSQFTCGNRDCVNAAYVCDGDVDCIDGSDEAQCGGGSRVGGSTAGRPETSSQAYDLMNYEYSYENVGHCGFSMFTCPSGECVNGSSVCDYKCNCYDCSDELFCPEQSPTSATESHCGFQWFTCLSGQCVDSSRECDNAYDCDDRSDERFCPEQSSTSDDGLMYQATPVVDEISSKLRQQKIAVECPSEYLLVDGLCVYISSMKYPTLSWSRANTFCQTYGGHLLTFKDLDQLIRILRFVGSQVREENFPFWVGVSASRNTTLSAVTNLKWKWTDGREVNSLSSLVQSPFSLEEQCGRLESANTAIIRPTTECDSGASFLCQTLPLTA